MKSMLLSAAVAIGVLCTAAPAVKAAPYIIVVTAQQKQGPPLIGTFAVKKFANINNTVNAVGTLTLGNTVTSIAWPVTFSTLPNSSPSAVRQESNAVPAQATASCPILHLVLGPLNLDLLGLQVTLNQVVLNITAIPGAGNLLGNLLCDVADLLNNTSLLDQLVNALNQLLASL